MTRAPLDQTAIEKFKDLARSVIPYMLLIVLILIALIFLSSIKAAATVAYSDTPAGRAAILDWHIIRDDAYHFPPDFFEIERAAAFKHPYQWRPLVVLRTSAICSAEKPATALVPGPHITCHYEALIPPSVPGAPYYPWHRIRSGDDSPLEFSAWTIEKGRIEAQVDPLP